MNVRLDDVIVCRLIRLWTSSTEMIEREFRISDNCAPLKCETNKLIFRGEVGGGKEATAS